MEVALSGSGLRVQLASLDGAVILCDALDECGSQQPLVTANLHAFSIAHPNTRVVVTSRPIGYRSGELTGWRHYELQPLDETVAKSAVAKVLEAIPFANAALRSRAVVQAIAQLRAKTIKGAAARSPLMITLVAALSVNGIDPGLSKGALYHRIFQLLQEHPPARLTERPPSEPERNRFLEILGWCLLSHGNEPAEQTRSRCAHWWSEETGQSLFISETKISECLGYWECLGIVERVRTHTQEAITFVHKTFGEFAAARYMSKCAPEVQRSIIERAIATPDWKEALSFASHLGLTSLILRVWAELAERGDTQAGNRLDDAVELVVQAGVPLASDALAAFTQCCWRAVENTASRVRYAAGEALCLVSQEHWRMIKEEVLTRQDSLDGWIRLVAWACLCVSTDQELAIPVLTDTLPRLADSRQTDSFLGGFSIRPNGNAVWQHLVRGAVRRILATPPTPEALRVLHELIGDGESLNVDTIGELERVFTQAGLALRVLSDDSWSRHLAQLMPDREGWNREAAYLLELIDDPMIPNDEANSDPVRNLELGACVTAISYWDKGAGDDTSSSSSASTDAAMRKVIQALTRDAGIDHVQLVRQARAMKRTILYDVRNEGFGFIDLPKVDAKAELNHPVVDSEFIPEIEKLILGPSHFFALNAAYVLYSLREHTDYPSVLRRLLAGGRGESLRLSAALACDLPDGTGQRLLLNRLLQGESTPGCRYLYKSLTAPYGTEHLEAVRRGLGGNSAQAAEAAAELAKEFRLEAGWANELRAFFDQWRTKEKPYPKGGGTIPESPRDALAKILAQVFVRDHNFLVSLLADDRPGVQGAAHEHALAEAAGSDFLRLKLLECVQNDQLKPGILRSAVSKGLYLGDEALAIARMLHSEDARLRYAALPILDTKYLPPCRVRDECNRLLTDQELDIREGASRALHSLEISGPESRKR